MEEMPVRLEEPKPNEAEVVEVPLEVRDALLSWESTGAPPIPNKQKRP